MFAAASSFYSRSNLSKFIHQHLNKINNPLSSLLMKSRQKTGNCTVANLNIVWHYQLASDAMQADPYKSFVDAYKETKKIYKHMRTKDQIEAFKYLLNDQIYPFYRAYFYDCMEVLIKFVEKDSKNIYDNHIKLLVNSADDKILNNLINLLLGNKFFKNMELYIDEKVKKYKIKNPESTKDDLQQTKRSISKDIYLYRDKVLAVMLETLPKERQKSIIKEDISLLKHVAPEIQRTLLDEDFNKYTLYASDDLKKTFSGYQKKAVESKYLEQGDDLSREFKASRNIFLSNSTRQKEIDINNKDRAQNNFLFLIKSVQYIL